MVSVGPVRSPTSGFVWLISNSLYFHRHIFSILPDIFSVQTNDGKYMAPSSFYWHFRKYQCQGVNLIKLQSSHYNIVDTSIENT